MAYRESEKGMITIYAPCREGDHDDCVASLDLADGERFPRLALVCDCNCHKTEEDTTHGQKAKAVPPNGRDIQEAPQG